ncbi:MAG: quinol:electron acceptor oxidoreductase subunit ActD [Planctomycetota bacterium]
MSVDLQAGPVLRGLLVEFDSPGALLTAAERIRDAGYARWDTHSPFPVHGIDAAMGIRPTRLPWIVFAAGVLGCLGGLLLQWWTNATNAEQWSLVPNFLRGHDYVISDKPKWSLPANIPVIFETTVLLAALAAVIGMLAMNNLPLWHRPLFAQPRFRRVTHDRFFVSIDARDPRFDEHRTANFLASLGGGAVERIEEDPRPARWPRGFVITGVTVACLALLPPLWVAKAWVSKTTEPRIHIIQDMDNQERYITQESHPLFYDGRSLRPPVPGTLARGDLQRDAHLTAGQVPAGLTEAGQAGGRWAADFPPELEIDEAFVRRGQQRFNIYCAPCHGLGGAGDGIVGKRAQDLSTPGWVAATSLHDVLVRDRPVGHLFNTITNGIRTMPPYGDQIAPEDRWAVIAYVRALQRSQNARVVEVPEEYRGELR